MILTPYFIVSIRHINYLMTLTKLKEKRLSTQVYKTDTNSYLALYTYPHNRRTLCTGQLKCEHHLSAQTTYPTQAQATYPMQRVGTYNLPCLGTYDLPYADTSHLPSAQGRHKRVTLCLYKHK